MNKTYRIKGEKSATERLNPVFSKLSILGVHVYKKSEGVLRAVIEAHVVRISLLVCFLFSVPPFPCDKLDLTMVLDRTESIGPSLFNKMKILAADLTDRYRDN